MADLLLDRGHQRIAYIAGGLNSSTNIDREKGFTEQLQARGVQNLLREQASYTYQSGNDAAKRLLQQKLPPDAIFCANDIMALGALDAARFEMGINVPDELSVIGFDDIPAASWPTYSLTTIRQRVNLMIDTTVELLIERLASPQVEPVLKLIPGILVERGSVRS